MYSIGAILSLIGIYTLTSKRKNSQSIKKTDDAVIKNNNVIKDAEEQIKSVDVKKEQVLDLIGKQEDEASFYKMLRLFAIKKIGKLSSNSETPKKINK